MEKKKVLIGSPVRQKHQILQQFLTGLEEADKSDFSVSYYFVDDNVDEESTRLLNLFAEKYDVKIARGCELTSLAGYDNYVSDEVKHIWDATLIRKVAFFKDSIIEYALENQFDYLFFIDSDIVLDRRTLKHLASRNVEIVSNVFWTQWQPNWQLEPQCFWMPPLNRQSRAPFSPPIDPEEARQMQRDFFAKMRIPGIYRVDGLGACTLIARSALEKGVRFREIPNLSLLGEDRHFCVRAGALGIQLYFDTVYPVYHIYREAYLDRVDEFKREGFQYDMCQTYHAVAGGPKEPELKRILKKACSYIWRKGTSRIRAKWNPPLRYDRSSLKESVAVHIVVQENTKKYLEETLESVLGLADYCLILDMTTSGIPERITQWEKLCRVIKKSAGTENGHQQLWQETERYNPGWVLALDAGEVLTHDAIAATRYLLRNTSIDSYRFRRLDMWNREEYRADSGWSGQNVYFPYLMRYRKGYRYRWNAQQQNAKFPDEITQVLYANINIHVRNYCWADMQDRQHENLATSGGNEQLVLKRMDALSEEL